MTAAVFVFAAPAAVSQPAGPAVPAISDDKKLDTRDRQLVAEAERSGRSEVTLLVAAEPGRTDAAANELRSLGGRVETAEKDVDYLKASVPVDKAEMAAKLGSVNAVDVDGLIALDNPRPDGATNPIPQPPPGADTPRVNPYLPTGDTTAAQFGQLFRSWDGKGTTIAVLDTGVDLDHPALATTSAGERKVIDWYTANSPTSGDGTWVTMSKNVHTGRFTEQGRDWTAPEAGGPYALGVFKETAADLGSDESETGGDINRDGDRTDSFGVLQDVSNKEVRVDLNGNGDFTDERAMLDYKVRQDSGFFGTDNPATPAADRVAFVVQTDRSVYNTAATPYVSLGIAGAAHGSHVAGIASGNALFGGAMAGAAPGAKLMSVKACLSTPSCTSSGLIDGVLYAARNGADLVNISIGGLPALNDGNNARTELYNRTIAEYGMQLFISAGNSGAGANTVGDPSVAGDAVSVGSYITKATWLSNYGSKAVAERNLHGFSSRGPREDGGFKPNIIAPGSAISSVPRWQKPGPVAGTYELPHGYAMFNGTSMAAPQAAGAAALVISAYKATHGGQRPHPAALRNAIATSATYVDSIGAYEQGAGLFNVFGAFFTLLAGPNPDVVETSVEVHTVLAGQLSPTPGVGVGIHDREGVTVGQPYTRTYTITRKSGTERPVNYQVRWVGNDGTFSSGRTVLLPLNQSVRFDVAVNPSAPGAHSALLRLDNPRTIGIDAQVMNAVFVPKDLTAAGGFATTEQGQVGRNTTKSVFVRVPEGATALKIDMAAGGAAGQGQVRFVRYDPTGVPVDSTASTNCYNPDAGAGCAGGTPTSRTAISPLPGVWEIVVEARRTSDVPVAPFSVTASVLGAAVSPNPDTIPSARLGAPIAREYTVTNSLASFKGRLVGGALGSAKAARPSIAEGASQEYEVAVPAGATEFTATIGKPSDIGADLDLTVLDCSSGSCVPAGQSADGDSEESVTVPNPAAGTWKVVVDGYAVPAGTTEYDYLDVFTARSLGSVEVADADTGRPSGAVWTVPATVTPVAQPGEGRKLRATLNVLTSANVIVGGGLVIIDSVTG